MELRAAKLEAKYRILASPVEIELLAAAREGNIHAIDALLSLPIQPSFQDRASGVAKAPRINCQDTRVDGLDRTPLHNACERGHVECARMLLEFGANPEIRDTRGITPLHLASQGGHTAVVVLLLAKGADITVKSNDSWNALHYASSRGQTAAAQILIDGNVGIDVATQTDSTALHLAVAEGHLKMAKLLVEKGISIDAVDKENRTPLLIAISMGFAPIVAFLVENGANVHANDKTALDLCNTIKDTAKQEKIRQILINASSYVNKNLLSIPSSAKQNPLSLRLSGNRLRAECFRDLASSLACTQYLKYLSLNANAQFGTIPPAISELKALLTLSLVSCGLTVGDIRNIHLCQTLQILDLSDNPLGDLPSNFEQLVSLRTLLIPSCNLTNVPFVVTKLEKLNCLDLSDNAINRFPAALANLKWLSKLVVNGCPMRSIPERSPTGSLLTFLKDLSAKPQIVYRSKLLFVGYSGTGKTTLMHALYPLRNVLEKKSRNMMKSLLADRWQPRICRIRGSELVYFRPSESNNASGSSSPTFPRSPTVGANSQNSFTSNDEEPEEDILDLDGATVDVASDNDTVWSVQPRGSFRSIHFRCASPLEREDWVRTARFQANNSPSEGITVTNRALDGNELSASMAAAQKNGWKPVAGADQDPKSRLPTTQQLELSIWDFSGQYEFQDGQQLCLTGRAIYIVLWDVTPGKRKVALSQLRHWLNTLQLQFGGTNDLLRRNILVYIVGTHADVPDVDLTQCQQAVQQLVDALKFQLPYRIFAGIDARQPEATPLKHHLFTDLITQRHIGEEVPSAYLDMEQVLRREQDNHRFRQIPSAAYRLAVPVDDTAPLPIVKRSALAAQLNLEINVVTKGLHLLNQWGSIIYLGGRMRKELNEIIVVVPEWLTTSVLSSLFYLLRSERTKRRKSFRLEDLVVTPATRHSDLLRVSSLWQGLPPSAQQEVIQLMYAMDICFPESITDSRAFRDRSSVFPQLLPASPPRAPVWSPANEAVRVIRLNGIPMGFHVVLFSRLRALFAEVDYESSWQCGFKFKHEAMSILVTIHDDTSLLRFCLRHTNASQYSRFFQLMIGTQAQPGVLYALLNERYKGILVIKESVECICEHCRKLKWRWNEALCDEVAKDSTITGLLKYTTDKSDLSAALTARIQPQGGPHEFSLAELQSSVQTAKLVLVCEKSNAKVTLADLAQSDDMQMQDVLKMTGGYDVYLSYAHNDKNLASSLQKDLRRERVLSFFEEKTSSSDSPSKDAIKAVENSLLGVFILSRHFFENPSLVKELEAFVRRSDELGNADDNAFIVLVLHGIGLDDELNYATILHAQHHALFERVTTRFTCLRNSAKIKDGEINDRVVVEVKKALVRRTRH